jgi:hypothetical protein
VRQLDDHDLDYFRVSWQKGHTQDRHQEFIKAGIVTEKEAAWHAAVARGHIQKQPHERLSASKIQNIYSPITSDSDGVYAGGLGQIKADILPM